MSFVGFSYIGGTVFRVICLLGNINTWLYSLYDVEITCHIDGTCFALAYVNKGAACKKIKGSIRSMYVVFWHA